MTGALAGLGPFFEVDTHGTADPPDEPWSPMAGLVTGHGVLAGRVAEVRRYLAGGRAAEAVELRVAASVTHLGLVARLVSPALAAAAASGEVLDLDLARVWWQPVLGGGFPVSVPRDGFAADDLAGTLAARVLSGPVRELGDATLPFSVSRRILWGNVASAVFGAVAMLAAARPEHGERAKMLAVRLLGREPLRGSGTVGDGTGRSFRRNSCCLIYRAAPGAGGPTCGDCVLRR